MSAQALIQIIKALKFQDVMNCLIIKQEYILLDNMGSKQSLLLKFGQFMSCYKRKTFIKNSTTTARWKLAPSFFVFTNN